MSKIFILSGAGLSAESGISTFRDSDGLWENFDVMEVCSTQGWAKDRDKITNFYNARRADLEDKEPNKMHHYLASLEEKYPNEVIHLTQNVDNLCEKAGSKNLVHLHGTLLDLRCEACGFVWEIGYAPQNDDFCYKCQSHNVRHNVVMFGESAPNYRHLYNSLDACEIFIALGTSGQVIDVVPFAKEAEQSIYVNIKREEYVTMFGSFEEYIDTYFTDKVIAPATQAVDELDALIAKYMKS